MVHTTALITFLSLAAATADEQKVVIPFDFESKFDQGDYGARVGEMIWKKIEREKKFVIPESMIDVRDVCERLKFRPNPETSLKQMGNIMREEFGGHIAIWGSVERVPPNRTDVYDLHIKVVDFSGAESVVLYDQKNRTKTVSEIPHLYVKQMLMKLHGQKPEAPPEPDPVAEKRWKEGPNLLSNGSFEKGGDSPSGWDPLPQYVSLVKDDVRTRHLKMSFPASVAGSTGVLYYSEYFPIEEHAMYRFSCRYRTSGSSVKVFIKCYGEFRTGLFSTGSKLQRREVYRSQQNLKGGRGKWETHTEDFTPKHSKYTPRWGRVMLYAYHPAGTVEWDDVVVKQIKPPPRSSKSKARSPK